MSLTPSSLKLLDKVHPDLIKILKLAASRTKLAVKITCGKRSMAEQRHMVEIKASKTMNSRHLIGPDGFAHAVDVAFVVRGKTRFDWPLYYEFEPLMKAAAKELHLPIEWGGDWESFKDGPHFQLPYGAKYPQP